MKKYYVTVLQTASVPLGEIEAENQEEANKIAEKMWKDTEWKEPNDTTFDGNEFDFGDAELDVYEDST